MFIFDTTLSADWVLGIRIICSVRLICTYDRQPPCKRVSTRKIEVGTLSSPSIVSAYCGHKNTEWNNGPITVKHGFYVGSVCAPLGTADQKTINTPPTWLFYPTNCDGSSSRRVVVLWFKSSAVPRFQLPLLPSKATCTFRGTSLFCTIWNWSLLCVRPWANLYVKSMICVL